MKEIDNIVRILEETRRAISENDPYRMKRLSNQTIHSAAVYQDMDNIMVAVLVYALSKVMERDHYREMPGWNEFYKAMLKNLDSAIFALEKDDVERFRTSVGKVRGDIEKISSSLKSYIRDVFYKAEVNKASKLYEHGLSLEQTSHLLGVSLWDLSSYVGQSTISEAHANVSLPIKQRIKIAEEIFS